MTTSETKCECGCGREADHTIDGPPDLIGARVFGDHYDHDGWADRIRASRAAKAAELEPRPFRVGDRVRVLGQYLHLGQGEFGEVVRIVEPSQSIRIRYENSTETDYRAPWALALRDSAPADGIDWCCVCGNKGTAPSGTTIVDCGCGYRVMGPARIKDPKRKPADPWSNLTPELLSTNAPALDCSAGPCDRCGDRDTAEREDGILCAACRELDYCVDCGADKLVAVNSDGYCCYCAHRASFKSDSFACDEAETLDARIAAVTEGGREEKRHAADWAVDCDGAWDGTP